MKHCLSIAGSDCSGGAGIQADLKTFAAHGVYGMSVITSVVAENTCGVVSRQDILPEIVRDQIAAVFEDIRVDAVKIGMLSGVACMQAVAEGLRRYRPGKIVIDPVMVAKGGCALMQPEALSLFIEEILPQAYLLTPNIPEAEAITSQPIRSVTDMKRAAEQIFRLGAKHVLVKGGHLAEEAADVLFDGRCHRVYVRERIQTRHTHGTGCTLSSAITSCLATERSVPEAIVEGKAYITEAIRHGLAIGRGHGPVDHFYHFTGTDSPAAHQPAAAD